MIDLRSDTVTQPTPEMREVMAAAEVGDDVYGDDPTVRKLEARTAELLGHEDAVFVPTGTMSNQIAIKCHTEPSDEVLADVSAHIATSEGGAPGALSGVLLRPILGQHGIFSADQVRESIREFHSFYAKTVCAPQTLLCLENTHNGGGGVVWPLETMREVTEVARAKGLRLHLDGARLWNASAASGVPEAEYGRLFDTVNVCFSKGLGAPMGSAVVGSKDVIDRARRFKQVFGGGFRQAGIMAAAALHALETQRPRLGEDHQNAARLAQGLSKLDGIELDPSLVQTNILRFRVTEMSAGDFCEKLHARGVHMLPGGPHAVRAVTHREISETDVTQTIELSQSTLSE